MTEIRNPLPQYLGLNGSGVNNGKVYIGINGGDPQTNPVAVFWDAALTIPATQPLATIGGYISNAGTPARAYTATSPYSIRVRDRKNDLVFYLPSVSDASSGGSSGATYDTVAAVNAASIAAPVNAIQTNGYRSAGDGGGSSYKRAAGAGNGNIQDATGAWWQISDPFPNVRQYGAWGDGDHDDTTYLTAAFATGKQMLFSPGTYKTLNNLTATANVVISAGAIISIATGKVVAFNGGFDAPVAPAFLNATPGFGSVTFNAAFTTDGHPEWWGAKVGDVATDCLPALKACAAAVGTTRLMAGVYYTTNTWQFARNDGRVIGVGQNYAGGPASIVQLQGANALTNATFWFGAPDYASVVRGMYCADVEFTRTGTANGSTTGDAEDCVKAVIYRYATNSTMERCRAAGAPVGFHMTLTATSNLYDCNYDPRASSTADICIGFLLGGYSTYNGFVGNNGSARVEGGTCFGLPASTYTAHTLLYGLPADTWIDKAEGNGGKIGIDVTGINKASMIDYLANGAGSRTIINSAGSSQDITISNPRLDTCSVVALYAHHMSDQTSINISNPYVASSAIAYKFLTITGRISFIGGEGLASAAGQTGLSAVGVTSFYFGGGAYLRDFTFPVVIQSLVGAEVAPVIYNPSNTCTDAVSVTTVSRSIIKPAIHGATTRFTNGVSVDGGSGFNSVDGTMIDYGSFVSVNAAQKVRYAGGDARSGFGSNVLVGVTG